LGACLDGLPALERRVLVLRSGLGSRRPRSRAGVGRALDLSARRVGRLERRGLRRLRGLARGHCAGEPAQLVAFMPAPAWDMATSVSAARGPFAAPRSEDRIEVKGEQESSDSGRDEVPAELAAPGAPRSAVPPPAAVVRRPGDGGIDLTLPLIALAALLGIALAVRSSLRTLRD
jgi:hypothetical protein